MVILLYCGYVPIKLGANANIPACIRKLFQGECITTSPPKVHFPSTFNSTSCLIRSLFLSFSRALLTTPPLLPLGLSWLLLLLCTVPLPPASLELQHLVNNKGIDAAVFIYLRWSVCYCGCAIKPVLVGYSSHDI